jgi:hypothetical protein
MENAQYTTGNMHLSAQCNIDNYIKKTWSNAFKTHRQFEIISDDDSKLNILASTEL